MKSELVDDTGQVVLDLFDTDPELFGSDLELFSSDPELFSSDPELFAAVARELPDVERLKREPEELLTDAELLGTGLAQALRVPELDDSEPWDPAAQCDPLGEIFGTSAVAPSSPRPVAPRTPPPEPGDLVPAAAFVREAAELVLAEDFLGAKAKLATALAVLVRVEGSEVARCAERFVGAASEHLSAGWYDDALADATSASAVLERFVAERAPARSGEGVGVPGSVAAGVRVGARISPGAGQGPDRRVELPTPHPMSCDGGAGSPEARPRRPQKGGRVMKPSRVQLTQTILNEGLEQLAAGNVAEAMAKVQEARAQIAGVADETAVWATQQIDRAIVHLASGKNRKAVGEIKAAIAKLETIES